MKFIISFLMLLSPLFSQAQTTCEQEIKLCVDAGRCPLHKKAPRKVTPETIASLKKGIDVYFHIAFKNRINPQTLIGTLMAAASLAPEKVPPVPKKEKGILNFKMFKQTPLLTENKNAQDIAINIRKIENQRFVEQKDDWDRADRVATLFGQSGTGAVVQKASTGQANNDWGVFINCHQNEIADVLKSILNGANVIVEDGCVTSPKIAKNAGKSDVNKKMIMPDWKYKCMEMNGTYKFEPEIQEAFLQPASN